ncbi:MAG: helix-turn-helix transcriptional regulator [Armatimonadetes bacterium]|nr:helix-turn-helix transcriptional regulator [Armatimonadota bacterium]
MPRTADVKPRGPKSRADWAVALRLRWGRQVAGLTQDEAALLLGVTQSALARYETGASSPPAAVLRRAALLYGVSGNFLLGLTGGLELLPQSESEEAAKEEFLRSDLARALQVTEEEAEKLRGARLFDERVAVRRCPGFWASWLLKTRREAEMRKERAKKKGKAEEKEGDK